MNGDTKTGNTLTGKVVYWGPKGSGKTASLLSLRRFLDAEGRMYVYSINAGEEGTLFFDLFHLEDFHLGTHRIRTRILTGPGGANRSETRRYLLRGADAVVFVADARRSAFEANRASLHDLDESLHAEGVKPESIPIVYAFNHQDDVSPVPSRELSQLLGLDTDAHIVETVATLGMGVFDCFSEAFRRMIESIASKVNIEDVEESIVIPSKHMQQLFLGNKTSMAESAGGQIVISLPDRLAEGGEGSVVDEACVQLGHEAIEAQLHLAENSVELFARNRMMDQRNHELMAINRVAHSILGAMEADNLLMVLLDSTAEYLQASHATCVVFDGSGGQALRTHVRGFGRDPVLGLPREQAQVFLDIVQNSDGPIPLQKGRNPELLDALRKVDVRIEGAFFAPIKSAGQPAGWIGIYQVAGERVLNTRELLFLSSISRLAALGLEKIDFLEEMQRFTREQEEDVHERTAKLEVANAKIRALNRGAESHIAERTQTLEAANKALRDSSASAVSLARLSGMGQLAAAFAREVNSPVAGLKANLDHMRESLDDLRERVALTSADAADGLKAIKEFEDVIAESVQSAERITGVISSLKRFGGEGHTSNTFALNAAIADAATLLEERIQTCGRLDLRLGTVPEIAGDSLELSQVVLALLTNAIEASERKVGDARIEVTTFSTGDDVTVVIKDDGDGIPAELLPKVFEPFVTTKEGEPNAGLGLHTAYQAVHRHGGQIRLRSKEGQGTKVTVVLPAKGGTQI